MVESVLKKRNPFISYLKGWAVLGMISIHLLEWSGVEYPPRYEFLHQMAYASLFMFVCLAGCTAYYAYINATDKRRASLRFIWRGLELIALYFVYSMIKFFLFDFRVEPFYEKFMQSGFWNLAGLLSLKSFDVPITIIVLFGFLLLLSPLIFLVYRHFGQVWGIYGLFMVILVVNYILPHPSNPVIRFLYAEGNVTFPLMLWLVPYLLGMILAAFGLENERYLIFFYFFVGFIFQFFFLFLMGQSSLPKDYIYPLGTYYVLFSGALMYILIIVFSELLKYSSFAPFFAGLAALGDRSLVIYIGHWAVIDLTYWLFPSSSKMIWVTVSVYLILFLSFELARKHRDEKLPAF